MNRDLEGLLLAQLAEAGLPTPEQQAKVIPGRRYRFDFCFPAERLLVEVHGGTWNQGRHTRGAGFRNDREKMARAVLLGWRVLEFTAEQIDEGMALAFIREALTESPGRP